MARLTAPNGATVQVDDKRVERLVKYGFTEQKAKATTQKSSSSTSSKSSK